MSTIRQQIVTELVALLNTSTPFGVPACTRATDSIDLDPSFALPALKLTHLKDSVLAKKDERPPGRGPLMHKTFHVGLVLWCAISDDTPPIAPDDVSETTLAWIEACIAKLCAAVPGALDAYVDETGWEIRTGQIPYCRMLTAVGVQYTHRVGDATQRA